jgi:hypothetical protein
MFPSLFSTRLSAMELRLLAEGPYFRDLISRGLVSPGPYDARGKIRKICGSIPDFYGEGCDAFSSMRRIFASHLAGTVYAHAFVITAPHTHWGPKPIVYRCISKEMYQVGPLDFFSDLKELWPVSFVFAEEGLLPYEWAEVISEEQMNGYGDVLGLLQGIHQTLLAPELDVERRSFGAALNFRFKSLLEPALFPTMEEPGKGILSIDRRPNLSDIAAPDQVSWTLVGWDADPQIATAANFITESLLSLNMDEARAVFNAMRAQLSSRS